MKAERERVKRKGRNGERNIWEGEEGRESSSCCAKKC